MEVPLSVIGRRWPERTPMRVVFWALVCVVAGGSGCPAETLGIELPPPGSAAISPDDVQRDTRGLVGEDGEAFFVRRLERMNLDVDRGDGWICGVRDGASGRGAGSASGQARTVVAPWPADVDSAAAGAVLISVAKAWDTLDGPTARRALCVARVDAAPPIEGERVDLGAFAPGALITGSHDPATGGEGAAEAALHSGTPDGSRAVEAVDYRELAEKARAVFARVQ